MVDMMQSQSMVKAGPRYDAATIGLHWATAGLVVTQFGLAELWDLVPHPVHHLMVVAHMSLGMMLAVVFAVRLVWRGRFGRHLPPAGWGVLDKVAKAMHRALYVLLGVEIVLGFVTRWTDNQALSFFGLLIPSPFGHFSRSTGWVVGQIHDYVAWTIIVLAALHAGAALFHHYVLKDGVLRRMGA